MAPEQEAIARKEFARLFPERCVPGSYWDVYVAGLGVGAGLATMEALIAVGRPCYVKFRGNGGQHERPKA